MVNCLALYPAVVGEEPAQQGLRDQLDLLDLLVLLGVPQQVML